ncbi:rhamnose ABC transporter substrate-binding protein [Rhizobium rhizosphaerae]|uniref:Rhamnose ABC transporter substrate-binding protein n=1 Tax=Xaviernesmea rhizosphaerae TaxID=1672749 RepID=A0A1Q9ADL9_9HYPH|nr:rhamnose ABC transporter substrate-binding protein [Xaviernesmea rhizosphaerae]OLP53007.1 rhamnose ABC transporter substrate-binding protein [Xaviernesmea rhizosphaerae]OQP87428.1 rhamnose ABC transporter substrate-binding protein [Xaviernesmea rhizosphaerae]
MKLKTALAAGVALAVALMAGAASAADMKIGLVVKSLGNGFFEAANKGAQEAAKELGGVEIIYTGPTTTTAEGQIEVINALIAQGVNAIAISANDPDAVVPALKKAAQRGIKVISWDSGVAPAGRILQLNPSSNELIGKMCLQLAADHLEGGKGDFAILSATTTSTNQNIWIGEMKKQLKDFPGLKLVTTVYGDDLSDKSYREAQGLLTAHPDVKVIVAPTTVGVLAASQAVKDAGKIGQVYVTGLGLPSEMAGAIKSGATKEFAIWNPIDLGYTATQISYHLVKGDTDGKPGSEIEAGRMGKIKVGANGEAAMGDPFVYNAGNIDQFSKVF